MNFRPSVVLKLAAKLISKQKFLIPQCESSGVAKRAMLDCNPIASGYWWIVSDSNREPSGYEPDALTVALTIHIAYADKLHKLSV